MIQEYYKYMLNNQKDQEWVLCQQGKLKQFLVSANLLIIKWWPMSRSVGKTFLILISSIQTVGLNFSTEELLWRIVSAQNLKMNFCKTIKILWKYYKNKQTNNGKKELNKPEMVKALISINKFK